MRVSRRIYTDGTQLSVYAHTMSRPGSGPDSSQHLKLSSAKALPRLFFLMPKDLLFHLNIEESFNCIKRKLSCETNLLMWAGLRHSIPINLKLDTSQNFLAPSPNFKIKNNTFDVTEKSQEILII